MVANVNRDPGPVAKISFAVRTQVSIVQQVST